MRDWVVEYCKTIRGGGDFDIQPLVRALPKTAVAGGALALAAWGRMRNLWRGRSGGLGGMGGMGGKNDKSVNSLSSFAAKLGGLSISGSAYGPSRCS
ncbi:hypothetical protein BASA81_015434 [Batrachochytrium salamandrivorans]|nr:hypothetical protein BASA81_015434 [Batrachochytrium salamandrivorans]